MDKQKLKKYIPNKARLERIEERISELCETEPAGEVMGKVRGSSKDFPYWKCVCVRGDILRIKTPILRRDWVKCPYCGCKLAIADNTARCEGIYIKCRVCKREIEIKK